MTTIDFFKDHDDHQGDWCDCPFDDIATAFSEARRDTREARPAGAELPPINYTDVDEVTDWHISYHGAKWQQHGDALGSELELVLVMRLNDGRWAALYGWNDYTGWGCQDGSSLRIGESRDDVIKWGLDEFERGLLLGTDA